MTQEEFDRGMHTFAQQWEELLDNEQGPLYELACLVSEWITWLWAKPRELVALDDELAEVKFAAWRERLDFHLWSDPETLRVQLSATLPDHTDDYLRIFGDCQKRARGLLSAHGYERICPKPGELLVPVETVMLEEVPTFRQELSGRVSSVAPGKAGYHRGGKLLAPAEVVVYRYQPDPEATTQR